MNIEQKATKYLNKMFLDKKFRDEICKGSDWRIFAFMYSGWLYIALVDPNYEAYDSFKIFESWQNFSPKREVLILLGNHKDLKNLTKNEKGKISEYQELDKNVVFKSLNLLNFI